MAVKLLGALGKSENWQTLAKEIERQLTQAGLNDYTIAVRVATPEEEETFSLDSDSVQCEYDAPSKTMEYLLGIRTPAALPEVYAEEEEESLSIARTCFVTEGIASAMLIEPEAFVRANFIDTLHELIADERESQFV